MMKSCDDMIKENEGGMISKPLLHFSGKCQYTWFILHRNSKKTLSANNHKVTHKREIISVKQIVRKHSSKQELE